MQFICAPLAEGEQALQAKLEAALKDGKRVLWFISGGSNIPVTVHVLDALPDELTRNLTIMPVDERYGPVGHKDSNAQQLHETGFQPKQATFIPILDGGGLAETAKQFA